MRPPLPEGFTLFCLVAAAIGGLLVYWITECVDEIRRRDRETSQE